MEAEPDPVPSAMQEADHLGWLLYADKMDLQEGKVVQVAARVAERARTRRVGLIGTFGMAIGILVPNGLHSIGDQTHGAIGPIFGFMGLGIVLAYGGLIIPILWRTYSRIERNLGHAQRG